MKNTGSASIADALAALDRATTKLEQAADKLKPELPRLAEIPRLQNQVSDAARHNAILREAVGRVSARLDHVIGRLGAGLK
jgi:Tfp pilus assembly protein PilO